MTLTNSREPNAEQQTVINDLTSNVPIHAIEIAIRAETIAFRLSKKATGKLGNEKV